MQLPTRLGRSLLESLMVALLASVAMLSLRYMLNGVLDGQMPLMAGLFAVVVAAWYGGFWPGLMATLVCAVAGVALFLDGGWNGLVLAETLLLGGFVSIGGITSLLFEALHRAHARAAEEQVRATRAGETTRRSEQQAQAAEERLRLAVEATSDAVYEWDSGSDSVQWNEGVESLLGYRVRSFEQGQRWWERGIHDDDAGRTLTAYAQAVREKRARWSAEYRFARADGRHVWVLDRCGLVFDEQGKLLRAVGAMQDLSERRASADALAHFKALFEAQPVSVLVLDPQLRMVTASDAYLKSAHLTRAQIVGRNVFEVFPDDPDAEGISQLRVAYDTVLSTRKPYQMPIVTYAIECDTAEGRRLEKRQWSTFQYPVLGARGEVAFIIHRSEDVTELIKSEGELEPGSLRIGEREARDFEQVQLLAQTNLRLGEANASLKLLSELFDATREQEDPAIAIVTMAERLVRHLDADRCIWGRFNAEGDDLELLGCFAQSLPSLSGNYHVSVYGMDVLSARGQAFVLNDVETDPAAAPFREAYRSIQTRALIAVPLLERRHYVYGMAVHQSRPRQWTWEEVELVKAVAGRVGAALERARTMDALRESNETLRFLAQLSDSLQSLAEPVEIARLVCEAVGRRLDVDRCAYSVVDPEGEHYETVAEYTAVVRSRLGRRHYGRFGEDWWRQLKDLRPVVLHDVNDAPALDLNLEACRSARISACVLIPLHTERVLRAAFAAHQSRPRRWTEAEIEMFDLAGKLCFEAILRAQSAAAEASSRERLLQIMDRLPNKLATMTPDGLIPYHNPSMRNYIAPGYPPDAREWLNLFHPEDRATAQASLQGMLAGQTPAETELRMQRFDGAYRWHLLRFAPLHERDGRIALWVVEWSDQHDLKAAELRLREADRAKDEFLATLAHELRNPLGPISNGVQLLQRAGSNEALRTQTLELIVRQVAQMVRLVDDLLDISRITTGKLALRRAEVQLAEVVKAALENADAALRADGHELLVQLPAEPVTLHGDATRLAQVLTNLLTNSAKYSERPGTIVLRTEVEQGIACISVQDQGIGIAPEMLPRVFDMFAQSDRALARAQGGLGIGLSLVRSLVELHGGRVQVHSDGPGSGSTFTVYLPVQSAPSQAAPAPERDAGAVTRRRVLVADDNDDNAQSLAALLSVYGHEVETASDGVVALERGAQFLPDVMILDLGMPRLDGLATAREVRAQPWGQQVLLVALTGWGQPADRERTREAGFDHHLVKPVDTELLEKLLAA